jgi:5-methylcytosine-specific restriction endonuclease McrA
MQPLKPCKKCGEMKPLDAFHKDPGTRDRRKNTCRKCRQYREWMPLTSRPCLKCGEVKPLTEFLPKSRQPKKPGLAQVEPNCRPCYNALQRARYREKHPARPEQPPPTTKKCKGCGLVKPHSEFYFYKKNGRIRWHSPCKTCYVVVNRNRQGVRRARLNSAPKIEKIDRNEIIRRDNGVCYLCGQDIPVNEISLDHVIPLARGGSHTKDNLRAVHKRCNSRKKAKLPSELNWLPRPSLLGLNLTGE